MKVWVYQADIYCDECGPTICREHGLDPGNLPEGDSNDIPQGPYLDGCGEADQPQHCGHCQVFLRNPLTNDGYRYVMEKLTDIGSAKSRGILQEWMDYYELDHYEIQGVNHV